MNMLSRRSGRYPTVRVGQFLGKGGSAVDGHNPGHRRLFFAANLAMFMIGLGFAVRANIAGSLQRELFDRLDLANSTRMVGQALGITFTGFALIRRLHQHETSLGNSDRVCREMEVFTDFQPHCLVTGVRPEFLRISPLILFCFSASMVDCRAGLFMYSPSIWPFPILLLV